MYTEEILLSTKFNKSLPEGRRMHTLRKLKHFFTVYAQSKNKSIHTGARPMEIRGVPGVYKLRTSRGERILYEVDQENRIILREYKTHDEQILRAKNMSKSEKGNIAFSSLFGESFDNNEFDTYEIEQANTSQLEIDQSAIFIATDEWIAQCEDTEDYIWLASQEQAKIISSNKYPQFISGSAGTGKTTVLFQKLCSLSQNNGEILYITMSVNLKEDFKRLYEKFKSKQENAKIIFLTIDELYGVLLPAHRQTATQEQFICEFDKECQKLKVNLQDVWCEIEGLIKSHLGITKDSTISFLDQILSSDTTTLNIENYSNVKTKYSYFAVEQRSKIHEISLKYDKWLNDQNLSDINQLAAAVIKSGVKPKYDLIIIDEVQDFTELQLYMIMKLAKSPASVIFSGDINQNVRPTFFMFERLYNIYYSIGYKDAKDNLHTLTKNYRSCNEIVLFLNRILDEQGKRIGFQGSKEDDGINETGFRDGYNPMVLETNDENIYKILSAIFDKHYAIAVVPDELTREMISTSFPAAQSRIFTVQEAKGLEYNVVFTINITSVYEKEWHKILNDNNIKRQRRFRRFFGYIYVAASRARNHLIISEAKDCSFLKLVDGTYEILNEWNLTKVGLTLLSTADDFDQDARKLEKAGLLDKAQSAREMAKKIRERKQIEPKSDSNTIPINSLKTKTLAAPQKQKVYLAKRLILTEINDKKGATDDQGNVIIECIYDSISHSTYKDQNGKSVFECRLNDKITYIDRNGNVFKPKLDKTQESRKGNVGKGKKSIKKVIASVLIIYIAIFALLMLNSFGKKEIPDNFSKNLETKPNAPIADVIKGNIIQVAAGKTHSAALMDDNTVWTWGDNLLDGGTAKYEKFGEDSPLITTSDENVNQPKIKKINIGDVVYITAGNSITAAIKKDGSLWTWGVNTFGNLGNGIDYAKNPEKVYRIDSTPYKILDDVKSVSLGDSWGMAVKKDGTLWVWGQNTDGVLGKDERFLKHSFAPIKFMDNISDAAAGESHGLALKKDGTVWAWGSDGIGQLGLPGEVGVSYFKPLKVLDNVAKIDAGCLHSSVIKKDGTVWSWGGIKNKRLAKPTKYPIENSLNIVGLGNGEDWPMFIAGDGKIYVWDFEKKDLFKLIDHVKDVSMFSGHFLAIKDDGSVWAYGSNKYSQLGEGTLEDRYTAVLIYQNNS